MPRSLVNWSRYAILLMVIIRPTKKLHSQLPTREMSGRSDRALGDWYINRVVVARQPLLLLVRSTSLRPMVCRRSHAASPRHTRRISDGRFEATLG